MQQNCWYNLCKKNLLEKIRLYSYIYIYITFSYITLPAKKAKRKKNVGLGTAVTCMLQPAPPPPVDSAASRQSPSPLPRGMPPPWLGSLEVAPLTTDQQPSPRAHGEPGGAVWNEKIRSRVVFGHRGDRVVVTNFCSGSHVGTAENHCVRLVV